jgi:hypothetical protein
VLFPPKTKKLLWQEDSAPGFWPWQQYGIRFTNRSLVNAIYSAGPQKDSRRATSARATFGAATRDDRNKQYMDAELEKAFYGRGTPGPVYDVTSGLGKQMLSTRATAARCSMGSARRFNNNTHNPMYAGPGAGQYRSVVSSLGKQPYSRSKSLPAFGFGTSTRDGAKNVCRLLQWASMFSGGCQANPWRWLLVVLHATFIAYW